MHILPLLEKLDTSSIKDLQKYKEFENRKAHFTNLTNNVVKLQSLANKFEDKYEEILKLSASTLIGLLQNSDFQNQSFGQFNGLGDYLGIKKYIYIYDNIHYSTTKLRKGAPLYIIKGLESKRPNIRKAAFEAFSTLVNDYLMVGKKSIHALHMQQILFAISRAYFEAEPNKAFALKMLARVWEKDTNMLNALTAMYPMIPKNLLLSAAK